MLLERKCGLRSRMQRLRLMAHKRNANFGRRREIDEEFVTGCPDEAAGQAARFFGRLWLRKVKTCAWNRNSLAIWRLTSSMQAQCDAAVIYAHLFGDESALAKSRRQIARRP